MGTIVRTHTTCDWCGADDTREGVHESSHPDGWSEVSVLQAKENWGLPRRTVWAICPQCSEELFLFSKGQGSE